MPTADLRIFRCTTGYNAADELIVEQAEADKPKSISIWVPELLEVNALAAPLGRRLAYRVKQHELKLVLSFLDIPRYGMVTVRRDDLKSAARHIGAFVVESVGMGMLTATMRDFYRWTGDHDHLEHFDALPTDLSDAYLRVGVRPDLLFRDPTGVKKGVAGEARGRSTRPSTLLRPLAAQRHRLDRILGWSQRHAYHPVTMAWTYLGGEGLSVDLFDVVFPPPAQRRPAPSPSPTQPEPPASRDRPPHPGQPPRHSDRYEPALDDERPEVNRPSGQRRIRAVADDYNFGMSLSVNFTGTVDHLYETAPAGSPEQVLDGEEVRGDWVSTDLLGASTTQLFLGVLPEEPSPALQRGIRERRTDPERTTDHVQVDVFGRLIVAVSLGRNAPPPWEDVAARLG